MSFKLLKPRSLLVEIIDVPASNTILTTKNLLQNYAVVRYASQDLDQEKFVGKTIIFMDGIMETKFHHDHEIDGKSLTMIGDVDVIGFLE